MLFLLLFIISPSLAINVPAAGHFMIHCVFLCVLQAFSFLNGNYYIAMDLYEYTLDEYLYKLKTDGQASPLYTNKLVWQFLRGLNSIHQQCLMVHGDLKVGDLKKNASFVIN